VLSLQFAGGGWGDPFRCEVERVRHDVLRGYVSREAARDDYGVALADDLSVDEEETLRLRQGPRSSRRRRALRAIPASSGMSAHTCNNKLTGAI
jgi:N-methylhydantoinase B/oxoprolinase/acetone carboxylase alpha subunit